MKNLIKLFLISVVLYLGYRVFLHPKNLNSFYGYAIDFNAIKDGALPDKGLSRCKLVEDLNLPLSFYPLSIIESNSSRYNQALVIILIKIARCQIENTDGATYELTDNYIYNYHPFLMYTKKIIYNREYCGEQLRASCVFYKITNDSVMYNNKYINSEFFKICEGLTSRSIDNYSDECDFIVKLNPKL